MAIGQPLTTQAAKSRGRLGFPSQETSDGQPSPSPSPSRGSIPTVVRTKSRDKQGFGQLIGRKTDSSPISTDINAQVPATRHKAGIDSASAARQTFAGIREAERNAATMIRQSAVKPLEKVSRPTSLIQRLQSNVSQSLPVVPLIARPFATRAVVTAGQESAGHEAGAGFTRNLEARVNKSSPAAAVGRLPAMLAYGRTPVAGTGAAGADAFQHYQQPAVSADGSPSASGSQTPPLGLTHRQQPVAQSEQPRQVQVEAPREMEPEKLQRMIMKLPALNPEAIADKVYKALERKMKLEQRRNGY